MIGGDTLYKPKNTFDYYDALQSLDSNITNLIILMLLVEFGGKRMLFIGDGLESDIVESLSKGGLLDSQGRLLYCMLIAFKVPHNGSDRNTSEQLFEHVTAGICDIC